MHNPYIRKIFSRPFPRRLSERIQPENLFPFTSVQ